MKPFTYLAPIAPFEYVVPGSVEEAVQALDSWGNRAKLIAGGTDLTILLKDRVVRPEAVVDISRLRKELAGITLKDGKLMIGALTTFTELEKDSRVVRYAQALSEAASNVGTCQIRNLGTIAGNLANASPSADSAPPLIALSAQLSVRSRNGERKMAVEDIFTGVKTTVLSAADLITHIEIPVKEKMSNCWMSARKRNENALSIASVAVASEISEGKYGASRISMGSAAPTPILAKRSSAKLAGSVVSPETIEAVALEAKEVCQPSKRALRAGVEYRRHLVYVLTKRAIQRLSSTVR